MEEELAAFSSSTAALHGYLSVDAVADRILLTMWMVAGI